MNVSLIPCENRGTCEDKRNAYSCVCAPGYNDTQCEIHVAQ